MRVFLEEFSRRLPHMVLLPQTFDYLPNTSFRGPAELWVQWDPARNPERSGRAPARADAPFYIGPPARDGIARPVVVRERHDEGQGLVRLVLADPQGGELPAWSAGAHVDLMAGGFRRKYSLCGPQADRRRLQVVIQREAQGRGGSAYFCDALQPGCELQLSGPRNLFKLDEAASHTVLVAGGIGITPISAMADRLRALGRSYELHYAGRGRAHMALLAHLEREHGAALRLYAKDQGLRMDLPALLTRVAAGTRVYACGPGRLIDELERLATTWPEGTLRFEHFHAEAAVRDPSREHAFEVELRDSQLHLQVPADQTLLQVLQAAGLDLPCDCSEGLCGTCEVAVLAGQVDHRDKVLSQSERASHTRMLACCSRAAGRKIVLAL
jgi:ferredoxin-NADP reductase